MKVGELVRYKDDRWLGDLIGMVIEEPTTTTAWSREGEPRVTVRIYWLNGDRHNLRETTTEWVDQVEAANESR
jgi:hypothetical protein